MTGLGLPRAESPEQVGLSSARLERLAAVIRGDVERKLIPGAVVAIARGGRVGYAEAFGWRDREAGAPMTADAIFRVASMTKPITSVAAMMASLPLMFEPGTTWEYSMSTDVLGRVVEVVTGQSLGAFFAERICTPLGMADTGFAATGERAARLAEPQLDPATGKRPPMREVSRDNRWHSGGGGAVSTTADYLRFCQMLLNGGELDGVRLLAPKTIAHMASDHLPPDVAYGETARPRFGALAPVPEMGYGFGLGFALRKEPGRSPVPGSVGEFFWGGVTGTYFWIDPQEQMVVVLMLQAPDQRLHYRYLSRQLVYAALTSSRGR